MSSANMIDDKYLETKDRSFMYIEKGMAQEWTLVHHILTAVNLYISAC